MHKLGVGEPSIKVRDTGDVQAGGEPASDPHLFHDERTGDSVTIVGEPVLEADETSRSAQTFANLVEYKVPPKQAFLLDEIAANIDSNGEVRIKVPYAGTVRYTGSLDVSLPYRGAVIGGGAVVAVSHQSTDGTSATNRAQIIGREL